MSSKSTRDNSVLPIKPLNNTLNGSTSLKEQLKLLQLAVAQSSEGIAVVDMDGNMIYSNDAFARMHGYSPDELLHQNLLILHTTEQIPSVKAANQQLKDTGDFQGEIWHVKRDGTVFPTFMHNSLIKNDAGQAIGMIGTMRDITDIIRSQKALDESENRYRLLFENSPVGIGLSDSEGNIIDFNDAMLTPGGYSREDIDQIKNVTELYFNPEIRSQIIAEAEQHGYVDEREVQLKRKDGTPYTVILSLKSIKIKDKKCWQVVAQDIDQRIQWEMALQEAHDILEQRVLKRTQELEKQKEGLKEVNAALNVLLKKRDKDRQMMEENVLFNVKELIEPVIKNLRNSGLKNSQIAHVDTLDILLKEIVSPFSQTLHKKFLGLTLSEIRVANLVKEGKTTKEIAILLNSTERAIKFHRQNIRKKLGLSSRKDHLGSHLLSLLK